MNYGILTRDITKEMSNQFCLLYSPTIKKGTLFKFDGRRSTKGVYDTNSDEYTEYFQKTNITEHRQEFPSSWGVELSEEQYKEIKVSQKTIKEYTMAELQEKVGHNFKLIKENN